MQAQPPRAGLLLARMFKNARVSERGGDSDLQIMGGTAREHYW